MELILCHIERLCNPHTIFDDIICSVFDAFEMLEVKAFAQPANVMGHLFGLFISFDIFTAMKISDIK